MQVHTTKGIVLRSIKYGETSLITTVYTEVFGIQTYIVKGARQATKKNQGKALFFQPGNILEMQVYHNQLKNLQFVKEYQFAYLYQQMPYNVVKNAVGMYVIELVLHSIKQPETNADLFYLIQQSLQQIDEGTDAFVSNMPLYFSLQLCSLLGFQIQETYSLKTPILDLKEGMFVAEKPLHPYYAENQFAQAISAINIVQQPQLISTIKLNRIDRRKALFYLQQYIALHIQDFAEIKSIAIMQEVLG